MQRCAFQTGFMGASGFSSARWNCRMSDRWIQWYGSNMRPTSFLVFRFWNSLDVFSTKPRETIQLGDPSWTETMIMSLDQKAGRWSKRNTWPYKSAVHALHLRQHDRLGTLAGRVLAYQRRDGPWSEARLVQVKPVKPCESLRLP